MAECSGATASVSCSTNTMTNIKDWSISYVGDALETTDFADSGHRTYIGGLDGWSGTFTGYGNPGWDTNAAVGTKYAGKFYIQKTGGYFYSGSVLITGIDLGQAVDGLATTDYSFQGTAALTLVTS